MIRRLAVLAAAPVTLWAAWQFAGWFAGDVWVGTRVATMFPVLAIPVVATMLVVGCLGAFAPPRLTPVRASSESHLSLVPAWTETAPTVHATVTDLPPVRMEITAL